MKIKKLPLFLIICACAVGAAAFTACSSGDGSSEAAGCSHSCESWTETVNTCTAHAREGICVKCGEKVTQNLAPKGHTFGEWVDYVNNCKAHVLARECSDCGATVTMTAMPTGHDFSEWEYVTDECGETRQTRSCSACGTEENKNNVAKPHEFGEWTDKVKTCLEYTQERLCENCGEKETRELTAAGHIYENGECKNCGEPFCDGEDTSVLDRYNSTYGYSYFLDNDENAAELYKKIDAAVRNFHVDKTAPTGSLTANGNTYLSLPAISFGELGLTGERAIAVWKTYRDDNPLYYWISNSVVYEENGGSLYVIVSDEYADGNARMEANDLVYNKVNEYSMMISGGDAYSKAKVYHDEIINTIDYAFADENTPETADWAHSIIGVFAEKGGVCEAYARAFQILLNYNGVENIMVTGNAVDGVDDSSEPERHAWNLVKLDDGKWYWCDVTWDDTGAAGKGVVYSYFLVNDKQITEDGKSFTETHIADEETNTASEFLYPLPERSDKEYDPAK